MTKKLTCIFLALTLLVGLFAFPAVPVSATGDPYSPETYESGDEVSFYDLHTGDILESGAIICDVESHCDVNLYDSFLKYDLSDASDPWTPSEDTVTVIDGPWTVCGPNSYVMGPEYVLSLFKPVTAGYDVWVEGIQVTDDNKDNVLNDEGTPTVTFDPDTYTLTLNGAEVDFDDFAAICAYGDLTIQLTESSENTVKTTFKTIGDYGLGVIHIVGNLTIRGEGSLDVALDTRTITQEEVQTDNWNDMSLIYLYNAFENDILHDDLRPYSLGNCELLIEGGAEVNLKVPDVVSYEEIEFYFENEGISIIGDVTIDGATLNANFEGACLEEEVIDAYGNVTIKNVADVSVCSLSEDLIWAYDISITDSKVRLSDDSEASSDDGLDANASRIADGKITITDSDVYIYVEDNGIECDVLEINESAGKTTTVTSICYNGSDYGIDAVESICINGGTVKLSGDAAIAIREDTEVVLPDGKVFLGANYENDFTSEINYEDYTPVTYVAYVNEEEEYYDEELRYSFANEAFARSAILGTYAVCTYATGIAPAEGAVLLLNDTNAGEFDILGDAACGFKLVNGDHYVVYENGAVNAESENTSFVWKYDGGLYAEVKTTTTTPYGGWGWFGWGRKATTTTTTKYYLGFNGSKFTLSTSKVTAEMIVTADEHTWDYYHDGDGKHEAYCTKCGHCEEPELHDFTYDSENHKCFCGVIDPDYSGVTEVYVKENANTTTSYRRGWGWYGYGQTKVSSYTYKISTKQVNVIVNKVEYCTDGKNWKTGSEFKSTSKLSSFTIRVTDSNGRETCWKYDSGKVSKVTEE